MSTTMATRALRRDDAASAGTRTLRLARTTMLVCVVAGTRLVGSQPALAGTAPACIRGAHGGDYVQILNKCGRPERVQVKVRLGPDTDCITVPVGQYHWFTWQLGGYRTTTICG